MLESEQGKRKYFVENGNCSNKNTTFATLSISSKLSNTTNKPLIKVKQMKVNEIMTALEAKHPGENEYLQAVREVLETIEAPK